jgi:uncharacterized protein YbjQ (UPF0145 family)
MKEIREQQARAYWDLINEAHRLGATRIVEIKGRSKTSYLITIDNDKQGK